MSAPRLRITCCLCRKPVPLKSDVYALDLEWQRRYPQMVGILACGTCAVSSTYFFRCRRTHDDAYVPGHLPAAEQSESRDIDSWSHIEAHGPHAALVCSYPWSAGQQGAEDWLRQVVERPQLNHDVRVRIQDALNRRRTTATAR